MLKKMKNKYYKLGSVKYKRYSYVFDADKTIIR